MIVVNQLHGRPPRTAHVAQSSDSHSQSPQTLSSCTSQGVPPTDSEYDAYLRYQAAKSDSVAQTGNASACLTHTSSLGPWILDSGASDHISGNKDLFSSLTTTPTLPTVTLANGSQTVAKGIGLAHPLPSLPLTSVLYTPECPYNLISISKIVTPRTRGSVDYPSTRGIQVEVGLPDATLENRAESPLYGELYPNTKLV